MCGEDLGGGAWGMGIYSTVLLVNSGGLFYYMDDDVIITRMTLSEPVSDVECCESSSTVAAL